MPRSIRKRAAIAVAVLAAGGLGATAIVQASGDDDERPVSGAQADRAKAAALKITGGGTAGDVDRDDEQGATWEVEVTKPDGSAVEVLLDAEYNRVAADGDGDGQDDED